MSSANPASSFDELRLEVHHRAKLPERIEMVRDIGFSGVVLDAGCGLGQFSELIGSITGQPVLCVDMTEQPAHARTPERLHIAADIHALPLNSGAVDGVWCSNTLMYASDPRQALSEFVRVCRPGGILAIKEEDSSRDLLLSWDPGLEAAISHAWANSMMSGEIVGDGYMGRRVPALMGGLGLELVCVRSFVIERVQPFSSDFQNYVTSAFLSYADIYRRRLSPQRFRDLLLALDSDNPDNFFRTPGSHVICIETVVTGRTAKARTQVNG